MPRFFVDSPPDDGVITVTGDDAHHIARSLRCAVGEHITVCHDGVVYECELLSVRPECVRAGVLDSKKDDAESPCRIRLYVANPKGSKLDGIIQKATELGADMIVPFISERCVSRPDTDSGEKRRSRESRIALEAAKQCGRGTIPTVGALTDFARAVADASASDIALFAYEREDGVTLRDVIAGKLLPGVTVSVMTGPEGGFSPAEVKTAADAGMIPCGLGHRILRCETAPLYVLSAIAYEAEL